MKRLTIALVLALVAISSVVGSDRAWAGPDEATSPDSVQTP